MNRQDERTDEVATRTRKHERAWTLGTRESDDGQVRQARHLRALTPDPLQLALDPSISLSLDPFPPHFCILVSEFWTIRLLSLARPADAPPVPGITQNAEWQRGQGRE
jgi:hypothetical protein